MTTVHDHPDRRARQRLVCRSPRMVGTQAEMNDAAAKELGEAQAELARLLASLEKKAPVTLKRCRD